MNPLLVSRATGNVSWLAAQSTGHWNPSPHRRELVAVICDTAKWLHIATAKALHDLEPPLPEPYWLQAAEQSLAWCNTTGKTGHRAKVAWLTLGQIGHDQSEYEAAWTLLDEAADELRTLIGRHNAMLQPAELALVESNLGLARWAVRKWASNIAASDAGYSKDDAYQDAVVGLTKAAKGYDPSRGTFANYAHPYLYQSIIAGERRARDRKAGPRGGQWVDVPSHEEGMDDAEWATFAPDIMDAVRRVCRSDVDRRLVLAVLASPPGESRASVLRDLSAEVGHSVTALTSRWYELKDLLADHLQHLRAS